MLPLTVLDRLEVGIRRVDHRLPRRPIIIVDVGQQSGPRSHQILHPVRAHIARQHVLDLGDLAVDHLQAQAMISGLSHSFIRRKTPPGSGRMTA